MNFKKYLEKPDRKNSNFLLSPYFVSDKIQQEKEEEINKRTLEAIVTMREIIENEEKNEEEEEEKLKQEKELEKIKTEDVFDTIEPKKEIYEIDDLNILLQDAIEYSSVDTLTEENIQKYISGIQLENIDEENKKVKS